MHVILTTRAFWLISKILTWLLPRSGVQDAGNLNWRGFSSHLKIFSRFSFYNSTQLSDFPISMGLKIQIEFLCKCDLVKILFHLVHHHHDVCNRVPLIKFRNEKDSWGRVDEWNWIKRKENIRHESHWIDEEKTSVTGKVNYLNSLKLQLHDWCWTLKKCSQVT